MVFGIWSYKCHEIYTFRSTAPWFSAYYTINAMKFMCLEIGSSMDFSMWSYKCHETYTFRLTAPWFPAYEATNVMRFMCLDRELPPNWSVSPQAKHKIVFCPSKLSTLKRKLHGVWRGLFFKLSAPMLLCKKEQRSKGKPIFKLGAPRKYAKIMWFCVSIVKYDVFNKNHQKSMLSTLKVESSHVCKDF